MLGKGSRSLCSLSLRLLLKTVPLTLQLSPCALFANQLSSRKINAPGQFSSQGTQISYSCTASALGLHLKKLVTVVQLPHNLTPVRKEVNCPDLQNIRLSTRILGGRKESRSTTKSSSMIPSWPLTVGRSKFTSKRKCRHQTT